MIRNTFKQAVSLVLTLSILVPPTLAQAALSADMGPTPPATYVSSTELSETQAADSWSTFARSFTPDQVSVDRGESDWQINLGLFPISGPRSYETAPFWGISFVKPLYAAKEIYNECQQKDFEYDQVPSDELVSLIEQLKAKGENCQAASALRVLFLSDLKTFEKIDGWNALLVVLEKEGALRDFNIELAQYLRYKNPSASDRIEDLRFRQLKIYSRFIPRRHVNPRGTLKGTTFASEFAAMLSLFRASYPASAHLPAVQEMETKLFDTYVLKYNIPVLPVVLPAPVPSPVLIQGQKAFTPLALGFEYPTRIWTASSTFIDRVLKGQESLYHSTCGCSVQSSSESEMEFVTDVDGLGYSRLESLEKAQDTCVHLAQQFKSSRKGVAYTHECSQTAVALNEPLLAALKADYDSALLREKVWEKTRDRIIPSYQKVLAGAFTVLFSAFTWRNRGGGPYALGSTQGARVLFALLPQTLIGATFGYLNDGWAGARVGATAGALMTPALLIPWGRQMDMGRENGDKWEDFALLNLRGLLQTLPAAYYLNAEGKDAAPVLLGGLGMGPCYFAAWQWGEKTTVARNWGSGLVDSPTAWGELCWGGALGLGLMESLNSGD